MIDYRDPTDLGLSGSAAPAPDAHQCRNGWLGDDDHPIPCLICRPHLVRRPHGWAVRRENR